MTDFAVRITGFASGDAKGAAARVIATSPGFILSEPEALELLEAPPVTFTFEVERQKGEETLERLRQAGCELSYAADNLDDAPAKPLTRRVGKKRLEEDYSEEQLEIVERALTRMPKMLWGLFAWTFVIAFQGLSLAAIPVIIACPFLLALFALGAIGSASQEWWGYVLAMVGASLAVAVTWGLLAHVLTLILSSRIALEIAHIGPVVVIGWALFFSVAIPFFLCIHIILTLLKKPVRRWFS